MYMCNEYIIFVDIIYIYVIFIVCKNVLIYIVKFILSKLMLVVLYI